MKKLLGLSLLLLAGSISQAGDIVPVHHKHNLPACEPGYQWVEETCYKEVCRYACKMVPDVIKHKKWVYSCKEDPFCVKDCTLCGHLFGKGHSHKACGADGCAEKSCGAQGCGDCPSCSGPYCRVLLIKREVICEEPTVKCVVEKIVETVPYTVCKKVPCGTVSTTAPAGTVVPAIVTPPVVGETIVPPAQKLPAAPTPPPAPPVKK